MVVFRKCVIIISVCIISITNAETNGSKTVCVGSDVDFFCGINKTKELHIIIIKHKSNEIGRYSTDTGVEVYENFRHHYLIVKNTFDIQVHIRDVKEEDNGIVSCTVIYKATRVKYEWKLIIQERFTSSVIDFKIRNSDPCTVLTCSANSNLLVLKKPDNELIKGTDIVLDSCYHYLPPGEFTCCLMANCSEAECNEITLEDSERVAVDASKSNSIIFLVIGIVMFVIANIVICVWKYLLYKKKRKRQRYKLDRNQEHGNKVSTASQTTGFSDSEIFITPVCVVPETMLYKSPETSEDSGIVMISGTKEMSGTYNTTESKTSQETGINTYYRPQQLGDSVRSNESKTSKSSQGSHCSDNPFFISDNTEQIPMVSIIRNINK